jgi:hypothetical protein
MASRLSRQPLRDFRTDRKLLFLTGAVPWAPALYPLEPLTVVLFWLTPHRWWVIALN